MYRRTRVHVNPPVWGGAKAPANKSVCGGEVLRGRARSGLSVALTERYVIRPMSVAYVVGFMPTDCAGKKIFSEAVRRRPEDPRGSVFA